jgi:outer membrane protein assembly factor BamB
MMGISEGTPPLKWSESENIKWKVALEGDTSNSTPVVWGDKLFFQIAIKTDKQAQAPAAAAPAQGGGRGGRGGNTPNNLYQFKVVCLDRSTGKTLWQTQVREALPHEGHHGDTGYASYSPVTDGNLLWASFGSQGVYCLNLDGDIKWQKDIGKIRIRAGFGEGNSPLLVGNKLFVVADQEDQSFIIAFNKDTGDILWRKDRDEATAWASPIAAQVDGKTQIIVNGTKRIRSYDAENGDIIWECGGQTENVIPTPVLGHGMVFCTSGFRGAKLSAIKLGRTGDLTGTDAVLWEVNEATPYVPSPLLYGEKVYVLSGNNAVVSCYNALTGKPYYTKQNIDQLRGVYASPVGAADRVYFVGRNGVTAVLSNTADAYEVLAVNTLQDNIDASPVVIGDTLYLKGKKFIYAIAEK